MPTPPFIGMPRAVRAVVALALVTLAGVVVARYVRPVRIRPAPTAAVLVTFGDSETEGAGFAARPWPEVLAGRLRARGGGTPVAVVNAGLSGNRLLQDGYGPSGVKRFDGDVLARPGARWVTVLEGTNDLGFPGSVEPSAPRTTSEQLVDGYRQLARRAHAAGLKLYGVTLPPFEGAEGGYFAPDKEVVRQEVNVWIRTSGELDAVLDFDAALRNPRHPTRLRPEYDSGDHLHPNDAGHRAMGEAVDLRLFEEPA
ncbi:MAG: SGNH/GDSL hydrolase family protein [Myxococcaceae bacterium]